MGYSNYVTRKFYAEFELVFQCDATGLKIQPVVLDPITLDLV
jgi:hypothetical protein